MNLDFLQQDERLLSSDRCRYHTGPLAFSGDIYITDKRIIFIPSSTIDKLAGAKDVCIEILDIALIDVKGFLSKQLYLITDTSEYRFSGAGAFRIQSQIEKIRNTFSIGNQVASLEEVQEVIYIQGSMNIKYSPKMDQEEQTSDIEVNLQLDPITTITSEEHEIEKDSKLHESGENTNPNIKKQFNNTSYEVFFTKTQIRCEHSTDAIEIFLYENIESISLRNYTLMINFQTFILSITHNLTHRIYLFLQSILDGEMVDTDQFWVLSYGNSLLGNKGIGCMTRTQFVFIPEGLASVLPLHFPIVEIQSIYKTEGNNPLVYIQKKDLLLSLSGKNTAITQKFFSFIYLHFLSTPELNILPMEFHWLERYPRIKSWIYIRIKGKYYLSWLFMSEHILEIVNIDQSIHICLGGLSYNFEEKSKTTFSIQANYPIIDDESQVTCYTKPDNLIKIKAFFQLLHPFHETSQTQLQETSGNKQINIFPIPEISNGEVYIGTNIGTNIESKLQDLDIKKTPIFTGSLIRKNKMISFESLEGDIDFYKHEDKNEHKSRVITIQYNDPMGSFTGLTQYRTSNNKHTSYIPPLMIRSNKRKHYRYSNLGLHLENIFHIKFSKLTVIPSVQIQNISVQGCCIKIQLEPNATTKYEEDIRTSKIDLHDQQEKVGTAHIVWFTKIENGTQNSVLFIGLSFTYENIRIHHQIEKMLYSAFSGI